MRGWALLAAGVVTAGAVACGTAESAAPGGLVVIGGARSGEPAPTWTDAWERRFERGLADGDTWTVVVPDGRPSVAGSRTLTADGANDLTRAEAVANLREQARRLVLDARADDPGVDVLGALDLAARSLADTSGPRRILLADSLLQTDGALRFQDDGGALLDADPAAVIDEVAARGLLPGLSGVEVTLSGAGDTSAPQPSLTPPGRSALITLWTDLLRRAGATVAVDPVPVSGPAAAGLPPVPLVPVREVAGIDGPVTLTDAAVGFLPDVTTLRDPAAAAAVLAPVARALAGRARRVRLTGTTSSAGEQSGRVALSLARAAVVRDILVAEGVRAGQIDVRGVGSDFPGFVPDRDDAGRLDPVRAARNRQVIIEPVG